MVFIEVNCLETGKLFNKSIKNGKWIVLYHWNQCGHCIDFLPIWKNVVNACKNSLIAEVEYNNFKYITKKYANIVAFPTICIYEDGILKGTFDGKKRTFNNVKKFIKDNSTEDITSINKKTPIKSVKIIKKSVTIK